MKQKLLLTSSSCVATRPSKQAWRLSLLRNLMLTLLFAIVQGAWADKWTDAGNYSSSLRTDGNTYYIDSEKDLALVAYNVNAGVTDYLGKNLNVTRDLNMSGKDWTPIGTKDHPFKGNFDGGNHVISNITVNNPSGSFNGLFGKVNGYMNLINADDLDGSKHIRNIVVKNADIKGGDYTGAIAGQMEGFVCVSNLVVDGSTVRGNSYTAGIVGDAIGYRDQVITAEAYSYIELNNFLFVNGTTSDKDNKSYPVLGHVKDEANCSGFYFSGVDGAVEDNFNQRTYPITTPDLEGLSLEVYSTTGREYDGVFYAKSGEAHFRLTYDNLKRKITSVKLNGTQIGTTTGNYDFNVSSSQASYEVTVETAAVGDSESDPMLINSAANWNTFATLVNNGENFSGKFLKLTANISVSTMAGIDDSKSFQGTFDGDGKTLTFNMGTAGSPFGEQYCAPFRHVKNATIKNLHVAGTIYTSEQKAAGFVGESLGNLTLTDCISSVNINSSKSGDGTYGGLVSTLSGKGHTVTIDGCVFDGSFATTSSTTNCGGFVGWGVYNKPVITNSLMNPSSVAADMLVSTFARWYGGDGGIYEPTVTNCYYVATDNLPTDQGAKTVAFATAPTNLGALVMDYGMVKAYANGISYDGKYYAPFTISGSGTEGDPYIIGSDDEWITFASSVSGGTGYSGKFVKLMDNISVSEKVGTVSGSTQVNPFSGTFDGNGYTITATISDNSNQGTALFCYINGATIKNLTVAGTIASNKYHAAALVGFSKGTGNKIEHCTVTANVNGSNYVGGIVGHAVDSNISITDCVYSGKMTGGGTYTGVFVGWGDSGNWTVTDCLYIMADGQSTSNFDLVKNGGTLTLERCYKTSSAGSLGTQVYASLPENEISKTVTICNISAYLMTACAVSGIAASYNMSNDASITPVVTYETSDLTFGKDFTATLNGVAVQELPVSITTMGNNTLIITGTGDYAGSKSYNVSLRPDNHTDIEIADGYTYDLTEDAETHSATYKKTLGADRINKHQAWLVPFDYTITADDTEKFSFYKINMIANAPNAQTDATDDIWVFLKKVDAGTMLHANMPYVYKPKEAVTDYAFTTENATLKAKATDARLTMMTAEDTYTLYGTYEPTTATAADPFYYINTSGTMSLGNDGTVTVGAFRWIMRKASKFGGSSSAAYAPTIRFFDGDENGATGIGSVNGSEETANGSSAYYDLQGRKVEQPKKGLYIRNGRKVIVK